MTQTGAKLTFNDGRVFEIRKGTNISHTGDAKYLFSGLQNLLTFSGDALPLLDNTASDYGGVFDGVGAGQRTISISGTRTTVETTDWGDAPSDATAAQLRDELAHALTTSPGSSNAPIELQIGDYSDTGRFSPMNTVPAPGWSVSKATGEGESPSLCTVSVELYEAHRIDTPLDGVLRGL